MMLESTYFAVHSCFRYACALNIRLSLITGLLITGLDWIRLDWNPKFVFTHCGMQLP